MSTAGCPSSSLICSFGQVHKGLVQPMRSSAITEECEAEASRPTAQELGLDRPDCDCCCPITEGGVVAAIDLAAHMRRKFPSGKGGPLAGLFRNI